MDSSFSRMMIVLKQVTMILAVIPMTPETIWLPMYCPFPAKGDIKKSIGLFLKHIESSCEGNDFLDAVKFRFPIFFPVKVKKAQRDFPDGANALNPSKGDVLFFSKGNKAVMDFIAPLQGRPQNGGSSILPYSINFLLTDQDDSRFPSRPHWPFYRQDR